jgi:hypothetical protein
MTNDELFVRMKTREWERRFIDDRPCSIKVMIRIVDEFITRYGIEEYQRVYKSAVSDTAQEMTAHFKQRFLEIS